MTIVSYLQGEPALIFLCKKRIKQYCVYGFFFYKTDFKDWGSANYSSFAEAGYEFMVILCYERTHLTFKSTPE